LLSFCHYSLVKKVPRKSSIFSGSSFLTKEEAERIENREKFSLINILDFLV